MTNEQIGQLSGEEVQVNDNQLQVLANFLAKLDEVEMSGDHPHVSTGEMLRMFDDVLVPKMEARLNNGEHTDGMNAIGCGLLLGSLPEDERRENTVEVLVERTGITGNGVMVLNEFVRKLHAQKLRNAQRRSDDRGFVYYLLDQLTDIRSQVEDEMEDGHNEMGRVYLVALSAAWSSAPNNVFRNHIVNMIYAGSFVKTPQ